jgi:DNA-binding response OmpR family regulator
MFHPGKILVVDDEPHVRTSLKEILEQEGHQVTTAADGPEALAALSKDAFDLILVDLKMEGMDGLEVMTEARTAYGTLDSAIGALRQGAHDYLLKPCSVQEIVASVETGLAKRQQAMHRRELVADIEHSLHQLRTPDAPPPLHAEGPSLARYVRTRDLILDREKQIVVARGQPLPHGQPQPDAQFPGAGPSRSRLRLFRSGGSALAQDPPLEAAQEAPFRHGRRLLHRQRARQGVHAQTLAKVTASELHRDHSGAFLSSAVCYTEGSTDPRLRKGP